MPAVWARARSELRGRLWAWVGIAVLVGLAGGVVIAAAAGARRTDAAYPRFAASHAPADIGVDNNELASTNGVDLDAVARLPQVARASRWRYLLFDGRTGSGRAVADLVPVADADGARGTTINRWKILAGRRSDPRRADEVMASSSVADAFDLHVGSTLQLRFVRRETINLGLSALRTVVAARVAGRDRSRVASSSDEPALTFRVVGIEAAPSELPPLPVFEGKGILHLTPAFSRAYAASDLAGIDNLDVRLRPGADLAGFKADVERIPGTASFYNSKRDQTANVQRSIHVQALALWLLAALVGVSALLVLAQTLARQALLESSDYPTLRALGMTRAQLWAVGMVRAAVVAALGAVLGVGLAILASPLSPVGTARIVESTPGFSLDALALVVGAAGIVVLVVVVAAFPTWRAAGVAASGAGTVSEVRHSVLAERLARASGPLPAVLGVRLALEPGRGRSAVPVRSTVLAVTLAIATVTMAVTFGASLAHLSHTPRLYGWNWDAQIGGSGAPDISAPLIEGLRANPAVASFSVGTTAEVAINGVRVDAYGQDQVQGSVPPTLLSGRAPARPDEIVVGTQTLRTARAHIGQTVTVRIGARTLSMRVVGRGVFPSIGDAGQLGRGAQLSYQALQRLAPGSAPPRNVVLVRFTPKADRRATLAQLNTALGGYPVFTDLKPTDLASFGRVDTLPVVLAAILAVMAAATLTHTLITSIRRRRHDLAILKTLGLAPAQVRRVVAWQATTLGGVALLFGLPLGLAAGRWAWTLFADQLGVAPQPVVPALTLLLAIPATIILANLIATAPAWAAGTTRPALVLRAE